MQRGILVHEDIDDVGVAVMDLKAPADIGAVNLEGRPVGSVKIMEDIPFGHKVAMRDLAKGKHVLKYGRPIGRATQFIASGTHVHTHNLESLRWSR